MAGFSTNSYAKVWEIREVEGRNALDVRISITKKDKTTNEYRTEFSGFVRFYGKAFEQASTKLQEGDRIKLLSVGVENTYNKDTKVTRYYFKVFDWEPAGEYTNSGAGGDYPFEGGVSEIDTKENKSETKEPW